MKGRLRLDASADGLLKLLSDVTDDFMLQKIAEANYEWKAELHLEALLPIRDETRVPVPMEWYPLEVLKLICWSEPDDPHWKPGETERVGHIMRAFCCAALLRAGGESRDEDLLQGENHTLAQLLVSLDTLGHEFQEAALRFLVWRLDHFGAYITERPFFLLGILLLYLKCRPEIEMDDLDDIVQALIQAEQEARAASVLPKDNSEWLLGLTFYDMKHDVWRAMGKQLFDLSGSIADPGVQARVVDIAHRLQGIARA